MSPKAPPLVCSICQSPLALLPDGKTPTPEAKKLLPFCSARCQLVDLSNWLGERYTVPGDSVDPPAPEHPDT